MLRHFLRWTKPVRYALDNALYRRSGEGRKLEALRDIYKGKPLLIVGNGPSLNSTPLDSFADIPSIGMNKIDLIFPRVAWRPSHIICANTLVVRQHSECFSASSIPVYLSWKSRWFVRRRSPAITFFNISNNEAFSSEVPHSVGTGDTVTYQALQFAYFMGADPVIIVGVDHNFDRSGASFTYEKREGADVNHFDPNYFSSGTYWGLPNMDGSERAFFKCREAFEASGRRIVDATVGGRLQIFEKISIDQALALAGTARKI